MTKYFKKVLGHRAAEKSIKVIKNILYVNTVLENVVTVYAFTKLIKGFIKLYCTQIQQVNGVYETKGQECIRSSR